MLYGTELGDDFSGLADQQGLMTVAGFGSLLSETSSRSTFPNLRNFRPGKVKNYRRVFAHTADIFYKRGIANLATREVASLSCEPSEGSELVVALFEVPASPEAVSAFIEREHEFRFTAVAAYDLAGQPTGRTAVLCTRFSDEEYRSRRCPPQEWRRRWGVWGVERVWHDDLLPCRVYLRHCVLAARGFCLEAEVSFLDATWLSDRTTSVRQYLQEHPDIMDALPPPELASRYNG